MSQHDDRPPLNRSTTRARGSDSARTPAAPRRTTSPSPTNNAPTEGARPARAPVQRRGTSSSVSNRPPAGDRTTSSSEVSARSTRGQAGRPASRPGGRPPTRSGGGPRQGGSNHGAPRGNARGGRGSAAPQRPPPCQRTRVELQSTMTIREFSEATGIGAAEILKSLLKNNVVANINQQIDYDTAEIIAADFSIETVQKIPEKLVHVVENIDELLAAQKPESMIIRPPVVTIMGHVDHGKTKLLDAIRSSHVAEDEAGGITQHIGAYQIDVHGRKITFVDTPGHEAFTAMRARGAQVTDIVILVVAADDGVMPQTIEAISHVKAAGDPMIVAVNKIDLPGANPDRVKQQLAGNDVIVEDYGGTVPCVEVSARQRLNIESLLEMITLVADLEDLKANPNAPAVGTIIEAEMDKNRGPVATVLIQNGTLRSEDNVLVGNVAGKIKMMYGDSGKRLRYADPSTPVEILGLEDVPQAGDILQVVDDIQIARQIALQRHRQKRIEAMSITHGMSLDDLFSRIQQGQVKDLNIILKADVQGSIGAIEHQFSGLNESQTEVKIKVIHKGTGTITESDVNLAVVSNAIIIGFNARPDPVARRAAEQRGVDVRFYNVIYQLTDDIKKAMQGMLDPEYREVIEGFAEVRDTFRLPSRKIVAGLNITDGKVNRSLSIRVLRSGVVIHDGRISSLKRFKDDVREVTAGYDCGLIVDNFNDIEVGDTMEFYRKERVERTS